jgi:hypothetical protein
MEFYRNLVRSNPDYLNNPSVKVLKKQLKDAGEYIPFDEHGGMDIELPVGSKKDKSPVKSSGGR